MRPMEYESPLALPLKGETEWGLLIPAAILAIGVIVAPAIYLLLVSLDTHLVPILMGVFSVILALILLTVGAMLSRHGREA